MRKYVNAKTTYTRFCCMPCIYGMQLSYSSKFRVAVYRVSAQEAQARFARVSCGIGGGKSRGRFVKYDKYRVFPTSIFM